MNTPYRTIEESVMESSIGSAIKNRTVSERSGAFSRLIFESDSATGSSKSETIFINGKRFVKKQNNPWVEAKIESKPTTSSFETVSEQTEYKSLGEQVLNGKKVNAYQTIQKRNFVDKVKGSESFMVNKTNYYFDETGLMFKSESVLESTYKPKVEPGSAYIPKENKSVTKRTKTVEIDQNIKIEEPQIG